MNEAELFLDGTLHPDPFKYINSIDTTYSEREVIQFTADEQYPKFNRPREPLHNFNASIAELPIIPTVNSTVDINFTEYLIKKQRSSNIYF